jgi:predicted amidophosphoribosyltransferase
VFEVVGEAPEPVLIDDDVTTTGSTFDEVAGVLIRAGASTVYALALDRED